MSQPNRPRKSEAPAAPNLLPGVLSALVVVAVLGLLAVMLLNRVSPRQQVAVDATQAAVTAAYSAATSAAVAAQITPEPTLPVAGTPADQASGAPKAYSAPPPMTIDPAKNYTATITTPRGPIVVKLRPDLAPETVNSFVFLSREGFYNGLTWHRVIENFMAQGGDPTGTGSGGPGYTIKDEYTDKLLFDKPGLLAMASTGAGTNSGGSQFFITTAPYPSLNSQYTIFGEVVQGQEIVGGIPLRDPGTATTPGEQIVKIDISEG
ncbi:MAG: peptidylprolyl isomerase [Chloroflexales bacterium]|nr:peptidylprolyl isomerase [Chloroflexales bacterium]